MEIQNQKFYFFASVYKYVFILSIFQLGRFLFHNILILPSFCFTKLLYLYLKPFPFFSNVLLGLCFFPSFSSFSVPFLVHFSFSKWQKRTQLISNISLKMLKKLACSTTLEKLVLDCSYKKGNSIKVAGGK
jgi:hypothetical protein